MVLFSVWRTVNSSFHFKTQIAISGRYALFVLWAVQGRGWVIILIAYFLFSFFFLLSHHLKTQLLRSLSLDDSVVFQKWQKNVFALTSLLTHIRVFNADRMLYSRFRFQKSANLYLLRSSFMLTCLRLFQAWCIVCINDVRGLNRYFLIQDLFAILSLFNGIWNLSIYDDKVFYNLENNGIEHNLYLRMAFFKFVNIT